MTVLISNLRKPTGPDAPCYRQGEERGFYDAYLAHKIAADILARADLFFDANLQLRYSIECFLKYVFCLIREEFLKNSEVKAIYDCNQDKFRARNFGHHLDQLVRFLQRNTDIDSSSDPESEFKIFSTACPSGDNWPEQRYGPRGNESASKQEYERNLAAFKKILDGTFRGLR